MLRTVGSFLIATVCAYYGFASAERLKRRCEFLTAFITSLSVLETEICFGRYSLESVFKRLDDKRLFGLYTSCCENILQSGIRKSWNDSTEQAAEQASLKASDRDAVLSLGNELGMSDVEGQKKAIARAAGLATLCEESARDEYSRLGRVYRSCGLLLGAFVLLMFI